MGEPSAVAAPLPFRFGVLTHGRPTKAMWGQLARTAEGLGYSSLQVANHFSLPSVPPFLALAMAAEATDRLRLGTLVIDNNLQHPAIVANEAAWLSRLSGARFELGLGAGWLAADQTVLARPWPSPGVRVDRLAEAVTVIRACWAEAPCHHRGAHYQVDGLDNGTAEANLDIPLLIGGGGPRLLELAGREADIVSVAPTMRTGQIGSASARTATKEQVEAKLEIIRTAAHGRATPVEFHVVLTRVLRPDDRDGIERVAKAFGVPVEEVPEIPSVLVGIGSDLVDELQRRRATHGFSYFSVNDDTMTFLAPVVAALAGR